MAEAEVKSGDGKVSLETALDKTGFGLYSFSFAALTGLVINGYLFIAFGSSIIVPTSACELGTTVAQQGILAASPVIALLVGAMIWGYLGDTRGRRNMLLVSMVSAAVVNCIASISINWIMLLILQFIAALLASGQYTLSMTLLSECIPLAKRNLVLLLVASIVLLGQGFSAMIAIPIIPLTFSYYIPSLDIYWNSWRTLIVVYSIPSFVAIAWLYFMKESSKYVLAQGDEQGALEILRWIHRFNNLNSTEEFKVKGLLKEVAKEVVKEDKPSLKDQIVPLFKAPLLKYTFIMSVLYILQQVGALMVWLPNVANQLMQMIESGAPLNNTLCQLLGQTDTLEPEASCSVNVTAMMIVMVICVIHSTLNLFLSLVVDKVGRRNVVIALTTVCGLSGILINLVPNTVASIGLYTLHSVGVVVIGFYTAMTVALFPTHLRALAVSLTITGGRITQFATIQILNWLFVVNCQAGFYIFSGLFTLSAVVAFFLPDDRHLNTTQETTVQPKNVEAE